MVCEIMDSNLDESCDRKIWRRTQRPSKLNDYVTDDDDSSDDPVGGLGESHRDSQLVRRERGRQLRRAPGQQARPVRDQQVRRV